MVTLVPGGPSLGETPLTTGGGPICNVIKGNCMYDGRGRAGPGRGGSEEDGRLGRGRAQADPGL